MSDPLSLILIYIGIVFFSMIGLSIKKLSYKKDEVYKVVSNIYVQTAIKLSLLILVGLLNIGFYNLYFEKTNLNMPLSIVLAAFTSASIIVLLAILPFLTLIDKKAMQIVKVLQKPITIYSYVVFPVTFIFVFFRKLLYRPSKIKMTEEQFIDIIDQAEEEDSINEEELKLIKSVLDFDDLKITDIFTPRIDLVAIENTATNDEIVNKFKKSGFSRLPVYEKTIDNIIGIINHKDFYNEVLLHKQNLESIIQKPLEVPEYMEIKNLLKYLKINKSHMAIVKDEYGGTMGIVTMEDVLEELVGEIFDEHDIVINTIKQINDNKYLVSGQTYIEDLTNIFTEEQLNTLNEEDYYTVNGWVLANLGKMAVKGDSFVFENIEVTVTKTTSKQILEVEITINHK